jgi:hypothetical protein
VSWIPLDLSALGNPLSKALAWPVISSNAIQSLLLAPFFYFGVVSALLYVWLLRRRSFTPRWGDMAAASSAGAAGRYRGGASGDLGTSAFYMVEYGVVALVGRSRASRLGASDEPPNKGMKQTSVEHVGRSQLIPSVGQTNRGGVRHGMTARRTGVPTLGLVLGLFGCLPSSKSGELLDRYRAATCVAPLAEPKRIQPPTRE